MENYGVGSTGVAQMNAALTTVAPKAAIQLGQLPGFALSNIGVNDAGGSMDEATFETNYIAALDKVHASLPNLQIYLTRPWKRGFNSACDTMAGWIAVVQAARSTFVHLGDDERVWMKGADDGAAMTTEGLHYNAAGNTEKVNQAMAVTGH